MIRFIGIRLIFFTTISWLFMQECPPADTVVVTPVQNIYSFPYLNNWQEKRVVLEIGAGNGNLMSILKSHASSTTTIIDIDLPETISHSVLYIASVFPSAKILMPNEVESIKHKISYIVFSKERS